METGWQDRNWWAVIFPSTGCQCCSVVFSYRGWQHQSHSCILISYFLCLPPSSPASLPTSECLFHLYVFHSHLSNLSLPLFLHPILIPDLLLLFHHCIFFFFFVFPSPSYFSLASLVYTFMDLSFYIFLPLSFSLQPKWIFPKLILIAEGSLAESLHNYLHQQTEEWSLTDWRSHEQTGREQQRVGRQVSCRWVFLWWQRAKLWQMWIWTQESPQKCKNGKEEPSDILSPQELSAWKRQFPPQRQE